MAEHRTYEEPRPISKLKAEEELASGDIERMCTALVGLAFHESDWKWVQKRCLSLTQHPEPQVAGVALTCLGHLARIHRKLDLDEVIPVLEAMRDNEQVGGRAEDALDDIRMFIPGA